MTPTTTSEATFTGSVTFWRQIYLLIGLEAAVAIGWFAYEQYQPLLLKKFQFEQTIALLAILQGLLGAVFHPVSGTLADRMMDKYGSKFPVIISGITFAAIIFVAVAFVIVADTDSPLRWILPALVVLWLAAMSTFQSPALSLVESFAPPEKLPYVSALLVTAFGLVYAIGPFLLIVLNFLGLAATFVLGGILLAVTGYALRSIARHDKDYQLQAKHRTFIQQTSALHPATLPVAGFFIGLCKGSVLFVLPRFLESLLFIKDSYAQAAIFFFAALFALPVGRLVERVGSTRVLIWGALGTLVWVGLVSLISVPLFGYFTVVTAGFLYSLLAVSSLPFILTHVSGRESGWGIGLFYGGVSAAAASVVLLMLH